MRNGLLSLFSSAVPLVTESIESSSPNWIMLNHVFAAVIKQSNRFCVIWYVTDSVRWNICDPHVLRWWNIFRMWEKFKKNMNKQTSVCLIDRVYHGPQFNGNNFKWLIPFSAWPREKICKRDLFVVHTIQGQSVFAPFDCFVCLIALFAPPLCLWFA